MNLALCHEKQGRVATAYREYTAAAMWANHRREKDREQFAQARVAELENRLAKIRFDAGATPGDIQIRLDGSLLDPAQLHDDIPVDPGKHRLEVLGPGTRAWTRRDLWIDLPGVTVVRLAPDHGVSDDAPPSLAMPAGTTALERTTRMANATDASADTGKSGGSPVLSYVIGGASIASLALGVAFLLRAEALDAESQRDAERARSVVPPDPASKAAALEHYDAALTSQNIGIAAAGVGILGASTSLYLLLTAGRPERSAGRAMRILPRLAPNAASIQLQSSF